MRPCDAAYRLEQLQNENTHRMMMGKKAEMTRPVCPCATKFTPRTQKSIVRTAILVLLLFLATVSNARAQRKAFSTTGCPSRKLIAPCVCSEKNKGLDVTCERVSIRAVNATIQQLKLINQTLFYLKLRNLNMPVIDDNFFEGIHATHFILISSNVSTVNERAFAGLDRHLETLDLSLNSLTSIPNAALRNLRSLVYLNVNYNNISYIHAGALDGLDNLLRVTLYGNGLTGLDEDALSGSSHTLTRINLGGNLLKTFPINALGKMDNLEGLEIHENQIARISKDDFRGLRRLDSINLAYNRLTELQRETFGPHTVLNSLDVDGNRIANIDKDAFLGIQDTLEWLKIGENRLDTFPSNALKKLIKLRQLDLHGNNLSAIPDDAFEEFGHQLKVIDLHNNSLVHIPSTAFYNLHLLQWLHLNENKLKKIAQDTFEPVLDTLQTLDIHGNPLVCDCELRWFREWYDKIGQKFLRMAEKIQCYEPPDFRFRSFTTIAADKMTCPMATIASVSAAVLFPSSVFLVASLAFLAI